MLELRDQVVSCSWLHRSTTVKLTWLSFILHDINVFLNSITYFLHDKSNLTINPMFHAHARHQDLLPLYFEGKKKVSIGSLVAQYVLICESNWVLDRHSLTLLIQVIGEYYEQSVAASRIFLRVFLKNHKLYHLIKKEIHILTTTTIKKTRKYIKFIIAFYEFSYLEIGAR